MASGTPLSVERISGKPNVHLYQTDSATLAFYKGDLVRLNTDGELVIATDTDASNSNGILGIAQAPDPEALSTNVPVDVITSDGSMFVMKSTDTTSKAGLGCYCAITFTAGAHTVAIGAGHFIQLGLWDEAGATKARVYGTFGPSVLQSEIGVAA
jgi:hypothetical protein